ncbi:MAG: ABC transporter substrate-binding protein [Ardenticatenales bacterium]|nr:ABC transporter substrate-binding protein [Ardenticatenales bacterium]
MRPWIDSFGKSTLLLLLLTLAACAPAAPAAPRAELRIGVIAPLSGEFKEDYGDPIVAGAELAVNEVNDAGGLEVGGQRYKVVLFIEDEADNPQVAVAAANKLINQDNVVALIGVPNSRIAIPVSEVAENAHIPLISVKSTNPDTTAGKEYIFRMPFIDPFQGAVMATFAREELKADKAAVLYDIASAYNRDLSEVFKEAFEEAGGEVVAFESYTTDANEQFGEQLTRIQESGATVLFLPNYVNDVPRQVDQAREMGIEATFIGSDSWTIDMIKESDAFEGSFFPQLWVPEVVTEKTEPFMALYSREGGEEPVHEFVVLTYDAFNLLFQAIQKQGETDPTAIREGLSTTGKYTGVSGTMEFRGSGDPIRSAVILQIQEGTPTFYKVIDP